MDTRAPDLDLDARAAGNAVRAAASTPRDERPRATVLFGREISARALLATLLCLGTVVLFGVYRTVSAKMREPPRDGPLARVLLLGPLAELHFTAREAYRVQVPGKLFPEVVAGGEPMPLVATLAADLISLNGVALGSGPARLEGTCSDAFALGRAIVSSVLLVRRGDRGGLELIAELPLELYVARVLFGEMPASFHEEALKAQLVAARSYAYAALQDGRTLFADDRSQVYLGKGSLDGRADALARATCGQLLMRLGKVVHAYYHSTCGGRTQKASTVFGGNDDDATAERDCPYCRHSPRYQWQVPLERALLARAFGVGDDAVLTLTLDAEQKLLTLATAGGPTSLSWEQFRRRYNAAAETSVLHSAQFVELKCTADTLVLSGRGFGHGVGLCQYGADGMARTGASYREILSFYYPSADVRTCW